MHILIECDLLIPATHYGGTERVVWWLSKALHQAGHKVSLLVPAGSSCPYADIIARDPELTTSQQIPADVDVVHFNAAIDSDCGKPYLMTFHGNAGPGHQFDQNTVFISNNQAQRSGGDFFIHHGLDIDDYGNATLDRPRKNIMFLAKAAWKVKNVRGAIRMAREAGVGIDVAGGNRLNLKMGFRFTADRNAHFHGMVDQTRKLDMLRSAEGLIFPVLWHEPFGLAIIEAMYFGNPAFTTPWGSLPELIPNDTGFCSDSESELVEAIKNRGQFNRAHIHQYICDQFNNQRMARDYLAAYETVLNGQPLNSQAPIKPNTPEPKRFTMRP